MQCFSNNEILSSLVKQLDNIKLLNQIIWSFPIDSSRFTCLTSPWISNDSYKIQELQIDNNYVTYL